MEEKKLKTVLCKLAERTPEVTNRDVFNGDNEMYEEGDEDSPFFSEAYLYNLLGKEDARTLRAMMRPLFDEAGIQI